MAKLLNPEEMTSRDYYFDSYAHFGIHEVKPFILYLINTEEGHCYFQLNEFIADFFPFPVGHTNFARI